MAWVLRHPHGTAARVTRERTTTVRWPRGLALIGLGALLVSAWGGIVPYVGPTFGYSSNGAPAWDWTTQHALLYLVPGAVGVLFSLGVLSKAGGGRGLARASLGLSGLVLVACGAWFVIGPVTWPIWHPASAVFGAGTTTTARFVNQIGYNLGVGVVLAALGGMVMKASTGEREIVRQAATDTVAPYGSAPYGDRTMADPALTDRTAAGAPGYSSAADREAADREVAAGTRSGRGGPATGTSSPTTAGTPTGEAGTTASDPATASIPAVGNGPGATGEAPAEPTVEAPRAGEGRLP